ncbi:MAG: acetyl-CoA C-acyltransferase [Paracoccaceae bacterium]
MTGVVIAAAARTAVAPRGGAFAAVELQDLAAPVIRRLLAMAGLAESAVDELVLGNALGAGGNPARLAALAAGLPERVAGLTIDRQCCSGLDALKIGAAMIGAGQADIVIAGGAESYSRRPLRYRTFADGAPPLAYDRPAFSPWSDRDPDLAVAADALARDLSISRAAQDQWAIGSHAKARAAQTRLGAEIVPVCGLSHDPFARDLTPRLCARAAAISGNVTAANTAVAADAAAFCLMMSTATALRLAIPAVAFVGCATVGDRPECPGLAPVAAIKEVLGRTGLCPGDLAVAEVMEAYAAQAIACVEGAGLDAAQVNLGGGALARGHPIGASGAVNAVRLFHELRARPGAYGLAAIAAAGGLGSAFILRG